MKLLDEKFCEEIIFYFMLYPLLLLCCKWTSRPFKCVSMLIVFYLNDFINVESTQSEQNFLFRETIIIKKICNMYSYLLSFIQKDYQFRIFTVLQCGSKQTFFTKRSRHLFAYTTN